MIWRSSLFSTSFYLLKNNFKIFELFS
jgi:hypothetical protein